MYSFDLISISITLLLPILFYSPPQPPPLMTTLRTPPETTSTLYQGSGMDIWVNIKYLQHFSFTDHPLFYSIIIPAHPPTP